MTCRPLVSQKRDLSSKCFSYSIVHHPVVTVSDYESCGVVITWQPRRKFSCFRERRVSKSPLAPQDSINLPDYSQLSTLLFEVWIQRQRPLRLQYPQWFTEQNFTGKTSRTKRTNRPWGPCLNVVHKAYDIGSYSTQFREVTVVFSLWHVLCLLQVCLSQGVCLILLDLLLLALSFPSCTLVVAE